MGTSEEEDERNLEYFQRKKLPWLRTFFQERGIQTCSEGKGENRLNAGFARLFVLELDGYCVTDRRQDPPIISLHFC